MNKNKKAFSLILAMWLVLITSLLAYTLLEYMIPFWKNVKGIENSTKAYYQANNWIERGLYHFSTRTNLRSETSKSYSSMIDYRFSTSSSWTTIPTSWFWTSDFDINWDTISSSNPIQLSVWNSFISNITSLRLFLRVPNLDKINWSAETLSWTTLPIVNWQISSPSMTLNSNSWSILKASDVCSSNATCSTGITIHTLSWLQIDGNTTTISTFYTNYCTGTNKCILKFSVINELKTTSTPSVTIPYLEWRLTSWTNILPLRYSRIESSWKSLDFTKSLEVRVPQETVSEAFDFTIFQ